MADLELALAEAHCIPTHSNGDNTSNTDNIKDSNNSHTGEVSSRSCSVAVMSSQPTITGLGVNHELFKVVIFFSKPTSEGIRVCCHHISHP